MPMVYTVLPLSDKFLEALVFWEDLRGYRRKIRYISGYRQTYRYTNGNKNKRLQPRCYF